MSETPFSPEWYEAMFQRTGTTQAELFHHLAMHLAEHDGDRSKLNKVLKGRRDTQASEMPIVWQFFKLPPGQLGPALMAYSERKVLGSDAAPPDLRHVADGEEFAPDPEFDPDGVGAFSPAEPYKPKVPGASPELDVKPGAGYGTIGMEASIQSKGIVTGHKVVAEWVIPPDYLRHELGSRPTTIVLLEVIGDSMKGTLEPGDRVFVDTSQTVVGEDAVYVIDDGDGNPRVKRLVKVLKSSPPAVLVVSDNPTAHREDHSLLEDLRIIGRVVGRVTRM